MSDREPTLKAASRREHLHGCRPGEGWCAEGCPVQTLGDALAALLVAYRYFDPRDLWLKQRDEAIDHAGSLLTDAEMERAEKLVIHEGDFDDLA